MLTNQTEQEKKITEAINYDPDEGSFKWKVDCPIHHWKREF